MYAKIPSCAALSEFWYVFVAPVSNTHGPPADYGIRFRDEASRPKTSSRSAIAPAATIRRPTSRKIRRSTGHPRPMSASPPSRIGAERWAQRCTRVNNRSRSPLRCASRLTAPNTPLKRAEAKRALFLWVRGIRINQNQIRLCGVICLSAGISGRPLHLSVGSFLFSGMPALVRG
jgi:hypothetical protein